MFCNPVSECIYIHLGEMWERRGWSWDSLHTRVLKSYQEEVCVIPSDLKDVDFVFKKDGRVCECVVVGVGNGEWVNK